MVANYVTLKFRDYQAFGFGERRCSRREWMIAQGFVLLAEFSNQPCPESFVRNVLSFQKPRVSKCAESRNGLWASVK